MNDKASQFYLPTKLPDRNLSCVTQNHPILSNRSR